MNYRGIIIEESLEDPTVLQDIRILKTQISPVTEWHKTPWLKRWTLHTVEVPEDQAPAIAERLRRAIDSEHPVAWYADFKNELDHYIIFRDRLFRVPRNEHDAYAEVRAYGRTLGIPDYQLDFSPDI